MAKVVLPGYYKQRKTICLLSCQKAVVVPSMRQEVDGQVGMRRVQGWRNFKGGENVDFSYIRNKGRDTNGYMSFESHEQENSVDENQLDRWWCG